MLPGPGGGWGQAGLQSSGLSLSAEFWRGGRFVSTFTFGQSDKMSIGQNKESHFVKYNLRNFSPGSREPGCHRRSRPASILVN